MFNDDNQFKTLKRNPNLTYTRYRYWNDLPLVEKRGPICPEYLELIQRTMMNALNEHSQTTMFSFVLRFPGWMTDADIESVGYDVISRFVESLKSKVKYDVIRKCRNGYFQTYEDKGIDYPYSSVRNRWAMENNQGDGRRHYHVCIFVNSEVYRDYGYYGADEGCMAALIKQAWASALNLPLELIQGAVHFPENSVYPMWNEEWHGVQHIVGFDEAFRRASYLAKTGSKNYGSQKHHFDGSRR